MKQLIYFWKRFMLPHIGLFLLVLCTGMVAAAASGAGVPFMVKYVFPVVFRSEGAPTPELLELMPSLQTLPAETLLLLACASMPAIFLVRGLAMWGNAVLVNILGIRILETLRMQVFCRVQELPLAFMESRRKGDIMSRILADTAGVQNILTTVSNDLIKQPITAVCAITAFVWLLVSAGHGVLFLVNVAFIALAAWPVYEFGKRISLKAQRAQKGLGELNTAVQQNLETQREVRAYAMEEREIAEFREVSWRLRTNLIKLVKYQKSLVPIIEIVTALALSFLLVRGRMCGLSLTDFMAIAAALFFTFDSMKRAGTAWNRFNEAQGALKRLTEVMLEPNTIPEPENPKTFEKPVRGEISFRNVSFGYEPDKLVLRDVDLTIPAGQIVGLVGPSGSGKTTFASLIPRFYEATQGVVEVDGIDVRELRTHELREHLALVGQQALLFAGSIRDNIRLGRMDASEADILAAADSAAVSKFLDAQPQGIDTELGQGGAGLSGGQRQRVAIARAFVKNAPILILDEATASLDAESEREIQEELDKLAQGRTTLIVAHRFSTIRHAHRILVFDYGRIVGDGPHEELYASCPLYKELYDRQGID